MYEGEGRFDVFFFEQEAAYEVYQCDWSSDVCSSDLTTVSFCDRFVDRRSRTVDQMVQAARSGRQNIAEGSRASASSSQTELRLVNVARASLDELLLDYEDFLRQRGFAQWKKDDPQIGRASRRERV